ncbi:hypothetical protein [uncultured Alsobacter sp.]|uniref:hypothetical protein n=1 Tax=uncultured Alsobacter sp. TaxID=1748258 RepID=UPI0025EE15F2|nr:hypothetical protein [uncultured Alsobacter sp.]
MNDSPMPLPHAPRSQPGWTRDHVLGCLLLGVTQIEAEGKVRIASELRHLAMLWYTGARRASPARTHGEEDAPAPALKVRRRPKQADPPEPVDADA